MPGLPRRALGAFALAAAAPAFAQAPPVGIAPVALSDLPFVIDTAEQHQIKVTVLAEGFKRPFAMAFLPDGDLLITERAGNLRLLRDATGAEPEMEPDPVAGMPLASIPASTSGLHDIELAPDFAGSGWVYFTFNDPIPNPEGVTGSPQNGKLTLMRGRYAAGRLEDVETLFQGGPSWPGGSRIVFASDGSLFLTSGAPFGDGAQDLSGIYGKVLHLNADGSIPADNPFVGKEGANPAIYSYGHRDQHGLAIDSATGVVFSAEHGPNGGDEVNLIKPGANYGWPTYTFGRNYDGSEISDTPTAPGIERPVLIWIPSIAPSGLMFYHGDKFPGWQGNLFIGSGRRGEIDNTGGLERVVFGAGYGELRRETLLTEMHQRVRDVATGPDGNIYVLTDGAENAVIRIEPAPL